MPTESSSPTEAELLYNYLGLRIGNGGRHESVDHLLAEFAEYRRQLDDLRASLREAEAQSARGESGPLDLEALIERGNKRLAAKGITD